MKKAPEFNLLNQDGNSVKLSDYEGSWVVLYFYPKDDTPGCTTEACNFRDERESIAEFGNAEVIGISKDSVKSHKKFADKHNLNFTILSDESLKTIKAYNAWGERSMYGKVYMGIIRSTFIIDPEGNIVKHYPKVNPKKHVVEIINDLKDLQK
jgi:peroxiredoxin Q/BCP